MIKILGILDIIAAFLLFSNAFNIENIYITKQIIISFSTYLLLKSFIFLRDVGSMIDIFAGILLLSSLFVEVPIMLFFIVGGFLLLKGIMSLFA